MANNTDLAQLARLPSSDGDYNLRTAGDNYTWTETTGGGGIGPIDILTNNAGVLIYRYATGGQANLFGLNTSGALVWRSE